MFLIWEEVFAGRKRLVRVLPSQAANAYVSKQIVSFQNAYKHADVLAVAPYLTFNVSPQGKPPASEVAGWGEDQVLAYLETRALPEAVKWVQDSKKVADQFGLRLVAYEGGQHMTAIAGAENNEAITRLLHAANA